MTAPKETRVGEIVHAPVSPSASTSLSIRSLDEAYTFAADVAKSGFFRDAKEACHAMVKIVAGSELGIGPVAALRGLHVFEGKVELSAALIGALIKRSSKYNYRSLEHTDSCCRLEFLEDGEPSGVSEFTIEHARRAGLAGKNNWKGYPRAMLFARAISQGARWYCPDVFQGAVYSEGEAAEETDSPAERAEAIREQRYHTEAGKSVGPSRTRSTRAKAGPARVVDESPALPPPDEERLELPERGPVKVTPSPRGSEERGAASPSTAEADRSKLAPATPASNPQPTPPPADRAVKSARPARAPLDLDRAFAVMLAFKRPDLVDLLSRAPINAPLADHIRQEISALAAGAVGSRALVAKAWTTAGATGPDVPVTPQIVFGFLLAIEPLIPARKERPPVEQDGPEPEDVPDEPATEDA